MLKPKNSVADLVASDMAELIESDEYRTVFAKAAPKKDDKAKEKAKAKAKKEKDDKKAKKDKKDDKKGKAKKKASEQLRLVVEGTAKISEILDDLGFEKSATLALETLEQIVVEAKKKSKKAKDEDDKDDKDEDKNDAEDSDEEEDENDASDKEEDESCADDCMHADDKDEEADENDAEDLNLPKTDPNRPMPAHQPKAPMKSTSPASGYSKPESQHKHTPDWEQPKTKFEYGNADDGNAEDGEDEDSNDVEDLNLPKTDPNRQMPAHQPKAPAKHTTPSSGYAEPTLKRDKTKQTFELGSANADDEAEEQPELNEEELLKELGALDEMPGDNEVDAEEMAKIREELGGLFAEEDEEHHHGDEDEPGSLFDTYAEAVDELLSLGSKKKVSGSKKQ